MFSKRHYEAIARVLSSARVDSRTATEAIDAITWQLAASFRADNPRFDVELFARAAGVTAEPVGASVDPRD